VVDSLRRSVKMIHLVAVSTCEMDVRERVKSAQETDVFFETIKPYLEQDTTMLNYEGYQILNDGLLTYIGRMYIHNCDNLKTFMMDELHKRPFVGHPGYQKMITATRKLFYLPVLKKDVVDYLAKCLECQQVKEQQWHPKGLFHPLPNP
jgi:hypothetical protein